MRLFKSEYTKQFDEFTPSTALNEETLALMQEAQAHPLPKAKKETNLRWVLPVCASGAAAMVALTVGLAVWFNKPEVFDDIQGYDEFFIQDATPSGDGADSDDIAVDSDAPVDDAMKGDERSESDSDSSSSSSSDSDSDCIIIPRSSFTGKELVLFDPSTTTMFTKSKYYSQDMSRPFEEPSIFRFREGVRCHYRTCGRRGPRNHS